MSSGGYPRIYKACGEEGLGGRLVVVILGYTRPAEEKGWGDV